jgi:hypothetical protein
VEVALVGGGGPAARGRDRLQRKHGAVGIGCRGNTAKIRNLEHGRSGYWWRQGNLLQTEQIYSILYRIIRCCTNKGERCTSNKNIGQTEIALSSTRETEETKF